MARQTVGSFGKKKEYSGYASKDTKGRYYFVTAGEEHLQDESARQD